MRVAFDSQIFSLQQYGGISRYICNLAANLSNIEGVDAKIFAPFNINAHLQQLPKEIVHGVKVPHIPIVERAFTLSSSWLAPGAITRFEPNIIHETYYDSRPTSVRNVRTVVTVHDMIHEIYSSEFSKSNRTSELKRKVTQRADHVICVSENTRKDLLEIFGLSEDKTSVIHHGFSKLTPVANVEGAKNKPYILYVGSRKSYKNFRGFLRAYATSSWLSNAFHVVCFGGGTFSVDELKLFGELRISLSQIIQRDGNDQMLAQCYQNAALFVYPSLYEGFGLPLLEAMSLDCPVACSDSSSIPEVVANAAEYFDATDFESIRAVMEYVLNSPTRRAELAVLGRARYVEFSWERCADETQAAYTRIL